MRSPFDLRRGKILVRRVVVAAAGLLILGLAVVICLRSPAFLFEFLLQFRIVNASGKEVAVTSAHTHQTTRVPDQRAAAVPHAEGGVRIRQRDGKTWMYRNVSPLDLKETPYVVVRRYPVPFGGATWTLNLLLDKDGQLYVVPPDEKEVDVGKLKQKQPDGFPLKPEEGPVGSGGNKEEIDSHEWH